MIFLLWVYTSQDLVQNQQDFARSHNRTTLTFRGSGTILVPPSQPPFNFSTPLFISLCNTNLQ